MNTRTRIAILVIALLIVASPVLAQRITLYMFDLTIHGRPVRIVVSGNRDTGIGWTCKAVEMDTIVTPIPSITPTPALTVTPGPSVTPDPTTTPSLDGYVGSVNGSKFHYPDCSHARRILPENLVTFATRAEALAAGYTPCGTCKP